MATPSPGRVEKAPEFPAPEPRKLLAARIVALGAIPIAVFCGVYVLMRQLLGSENITAQAWTISVSLLGSIASVFLLSRLLAHTIVDEVEALRDGVRAIAQGGEAPDIATLTPPLEELKHELLGFAREFHGQHARIQERLDTARQQIFFLTNHDALTGLPNRKLLEERSEERRVGKECRSRWSPYH